MALNLAKGAGLSLRKTNGSVLTRAIVELFWSPTGAKAPYDLDASALLASADLTNANDFGKSVGDHGVCFYGQPQTSAIQASGDNKNGVSEEGKPDEVLTIDLTKVDANANVIPVFITIHEAAQRGQTFADVQDPHAILKDADTGEVLARVDLTGLTPGSTGAIFVVLKREGAGWKAENVSMGFPGKDLLSFLSLYGVQAGY